jgi:glycosyltransferase involved in cell wall biosynthesis
MKVAIDASSLVINRFSGLAEVVHNLIYNLSLDRNDSHYTLFTNFFRTHTFNRDFCYPGTTNRFLRIPRRLVDLWWQHDWPEIDFYLKGIDIFHSLHINVPPTKKIKTVLTVHDCRYLALPELYNPQDVDVYRKQMMHSLSRVDQITTVSEFTRQEVLNYFSFPEDRIRTIQNGISVNLHKKELEKKIIRRFLKNNNLPQEYLLFPGVIDPRKNLSRLIEAFAVCKKERHDFPSLILTGTTFKQWARSNQARKGKELGVFNNIHVSGFIEKHILYGLIKNAIALCYPSLYEGFGFPPLEAMSFGIPVLAGKSSSIPEITGTAACLVDPFSIDEIAQGLNRIVFDGAYRNTLIKSGYDHIKKFSWRKATEEYVSLYKEMVN